MVGETPTSGSATGSLLSDHPNPPARSAHLMCRFAMECITRMNYMMRKPMVNLAFFCSAWLLPFSAHGAEIALVPVSADGVHSIAGNQITLQGGGQRVFLELFVSSWAPNNLQAWQVVIDRSGYTSGTSGVITPATEGCTADADCETAFAPGSRCSVPVVNPNRCAPGFIDVGRPDYVFESVTDIAAVDISTLAYRYASTTLFGAIADPGGDHYAGTLVLDVPTGAIGTFTVGFNLPSCAGGGDSGLPCDPEDAGACPGGFCQIDSFMQDGNTNMIPDLILSSALIVIACETSAECDDGNECTTDSCQPNGTCTNDNNFNELTQCCDPLTGFVVMIDDGIECTDDVCDTATGIVSNDPFAQGTACGDPSDSQCDNPDSCDGFGVCDDNLEPFGFGCGDASNTDCTQPDSCDGSGVCLANHNVAGAACGDSTDDACTDPDSCDGSGTCLSNHAADGTVCDDGFFCNVGEMCAGGQCGGGSARDCDDALTCTTDSCDEAGSSCVNDLDAGFCLIDGVCQSEGALNPDNDCQACMTALSTLDWSFSPAGSECDDGDACSGTGREGIGVDVCDGVGLCAGAVDPQCNDQCAFAIDVSEGTTTGDNINRGPDDTEATCQPDSNNDVWFVYTASCNGTVLISTTGSLFAPSDDSVLSVYDGCPLEGGSEIACDDDSGVDLHAALTIPTTAGAMYWIRVAGFEDNAGDIALNIEVFDDCLIDGTCYPEGALNPENDCEACVSQVSVSSWSPLAEGAICGNGDDTVCDSPDACDGAGVCEANLKPDGTECPDEGNECSFDVCGSGLCTHPPRPAGTTCGDPTVRECDTADTCDGANFCLPNYRPLGTSCGDPIETTCDLHDICDGGGACDDNLAPDGTSCDDTDICTGDDVCGAGVCLGIAIPQAPLVVLNGPRHLSVEAQPVGSVAPVALRLTSPDWPCLSKYINLNGLLVGGSVVQLPDDWGTVIVRGPDIIPNSTYVVVAECGAHTSAGGSATTSLWGDIAGEFDGVEWAPPDGRVDILDLAAIVQAFSNLPTAPPLEWTDLWGCTPDGRIDIVDMVMVVNGFSGLTYAESTDCPLPCP